MMAWLEDDVVYCVFFFYLILLVMVCHLYLQHSTKNIWHIYIYSIFAEKHCLKISCFVSSWKSVVIICYEISTLNFPLSLSSLVLYTVLGLGRGILISQNLLYEALLYFTSCMYKEC